MKIKNIILFILTVGFLFVSLSPVLAQPNINELTGEVAKQAGYNPSDSRDTALSERVGGVIRIAMTLVGTIFLALTVYAGILWMTASGNEEKVTKATGILKMSTIGLIIVVAAYSITTFVVTYTFGVSGQAVSGVGSGQTDEQHKWYQKEYWQDYGQGWVDAWDSWKDAWK